MHDAMAVLRRRKHFTVQPQLIPAFRPSANNCFDECYHVKICIKQLLWTT